ncbi:alpha/beta fold hydrolase [Amycolatopsis thermalba]|uniref:alpha/beta fold hydrolase n=1 Tax=Amycolatopsis thermalba TaxID=944492 RepID=UPI000E2206CF|nr:alpha/beta fold hydrolase [Amycolatopsis thermalba]
MTRHDHPAADHLSVRQDGPPGRPALLLVHGSGASSRSWAPLVPLLTASHRVIRVDLPGHGRSAPSPDPGYEIPEQGRRVGEALDRLGVEHAVVAGHSAGGAVATALAELRPGLVTALALVNTGPRTSDLIAAEPAISAEQWAHLTDDRIRQALSPAFHAGFEIPQQLVDDARAVNHDALRRTMRASLAYLEQQPLPDRLAALGKPVLVLFGAEDRRWRPSSAARYRAVPGATVEMLPGLGHSPILEDPPRTAAALLAFTARISRTDARSSPASGKEAR